MPKEPKEEIQQSTLEQISALQRQIQGLRSEAVRELREKIKDAQAHVADLEKQLAELVGEEAPSDEKPKRTRKPSLTDEDLHSRILNALAYKPTGASAKAIATEIDVNYPRVAKYISETLSKNPKAFKKTGSGAGTKFFLP
jgi:ribosomal protein L10